MNLKRSSSNYQMWQIVISKDTCSSISCITRSIIWPCHCPIKRWSLTPLLWIGAGLWLLQPIEHDGRDGVFWGQIRKGDASSLLLTGTLALGDLSHHRRSLNYSGATVLWGSWATKSHMCWCTSWQFSSLNQPTPGTSCEQRSLQMILAPSHWVGIPSKVAWSWARSSPWCPLQIPDSQNLWASLGCFKQLRLGYNVIQL